MRLQLVSTYVSRYGSETSCPVYDPVLPKWDGKENITIAHARALKEVETVDIAPIVMETVDIEGLEIVVSDYKPPQPEREESSKRLISDDLEKSDSKRGKFDESEGSPIPNNEDMEEVLLEIVDEDTPEITGENVAANLDLDEPSVDNTASVISGTMIDDGALVDDVFGEEPVVLSEGWIKQVIFDRDWSEKSAKVQIISRIQKGNVWFLRIFDGINNTAQCCVEEVEAIKVLCDIPDNAVIEILEAVLLMGSRITLKKFHILRQCEQPLSNNLDSNFLNKQFFINYFREKGILRGDESGIRPDCPEYQASPIKMKTRSKTTRAVSVPHVLPCKKYLKTARKRTEFECQDCGKSFKSEGTLVKHMDREHYC